MLTLASLWLPIVLAAVAVFVVSSLIHMVFRWHASDYRKLSNEDEVREIASIAREFGFLASRASDFHGPGESWIDLGRMASLPPDLKPVWADW